MWLRFSAFMSSWDTFSEASTATESLLPKAGINSKCFSVNIANFFRNLI